METPPLKQHQKGFAAQRRSKAGQHRAGAQHGCTRGDAQPSLGSFALCPHPAAQTFPPPPSRSSPPFSCIISLPFQPRSLRFCWRSEGTQVDPDGPRTAASIPARREDGADGCGWGMKQIPSSPLHNSLLDRVCMRSSVGLFIHPLPVFVPFPGRINLPQAFKWGEML